MGTDARAAREEREREGEGREVETGSHQWPACVLDGTGASVVVGGAAESEPVREPHVSIAAPK